MGAVFLPAMLMFSAPGLEWVEISSITRSCGRATSAICGSSPVGSFPAWPGASHWVVARGVGQLQDEGVGIYLFGQFFGGQHIVAEGLGLRVQGKARKDEPGGARGGRFGHRHWWRRCHGFWRRFGGGGAARASTAAHKAPQKEGPAGEDAVAVENMVVVLRKMVGWGQGLQGVGAAALDGRPGSGVRRGWGPAGLAAVAGGRPCGLSAPYLVRDGHRALSLQSQAFSQAF